METDMIHRTGEPCEICETVGHTPMTQMDRIESMLSELIEGKRMIESFAQEVQGKGMLGMMSALRGFNPNGG